MICNAEQHNLLHPGSYGSRPGRTSTDPLFIAKLQIELSTISRTSIALAPNDASQCYDRILANTATLRLPLSAASLMEWPLALHNVLDQHYAKLDTI